MQTKQIDTIGLAYAVIVADTEVDAMVLRYIVDRLKLKPADVEAAVPTPRPMADDPESATIDEPLTIVRCWQWDGDHGILDYGTGAWIYMYPTDCFDPDTGKCVRTFGSRFHHMIVPAGHGAPLLDPA